MPRESCFFPNPEGWKSVDFFKNLLTRYDGGSNTTTVRLNKVNPPKDLAIKNLIYNPPKEKKIPADSVPSSQELNQLVLEMYQYILYRLGHFTVFDDAEKSFEKMTLAYHVIEIASTEKMTKETVFKEIVGEGGIYAAATRLESIEIGDYVYPGGMFGQFLIEGLCELDEGYKSRYQADERLEMDRVVRL